ncbi:MAG: exodeoxyribonuclease VII large subunit [Chlamydiota bacterium]|nr:exodeoxyribonuclease VII large subunit [Chlamydiota bacterium]
MKTTEKIQIYTVSALTHMIRTLIETEFPPVWVEGEVSNMRVPSSGHLYFVLKDNLSQIQSVCFNYKSRKPGFELKDGMKVIVQGMLSVYERGGNYQLNVKKIEPLGIGALQLAFEALKKKLFEEGLFNAQHKKPIPMLPRKIGIVTSPTGAAIRDILNTLERRFPNAHVIIAPAMVQGEQAPKQIVAALNMLNNMAEVDVVILTRGGGSLEDLMAFNDEMVARAIFMSQIPVISAIGHEIDWTIADFVSDVRAPTPTAAAEIVAIQETQLYELLSGHEKDLQMRLHQYFTHAKEHLERLSTHYLLSLPLRRVREYQQDLDLSLQRMMTGIQRVKQLKKKALMALTQRTEALSPLACLSRGYSITTHLISGDIVKEASTLRSGDKVRTQLAKGAVVSIVESIERELKGRGCE